MKFSLNHIKNIIDYNKSSNDVTALGVDKLLEKIGAQLGGVDEVVDFGAKYEGIIVAKVVKCEKHSDADKLSICLIDDGGVFKDVERDSDGLVQVVCGAPNVKAGQMVAWIPPGATVPESIGNDPFVLTKREIRGVVSNGMLASLKELALGESHDGILELPSDFKPGSDFAEAMYFKGDLIIDIENKMFTHRPDAFGWLGICRELAGIQGLAFKSPAWYVTAPEFPKPTGAELKLSVQNELPELVPRFTVIAMSNVEVRPSNIWIQAELAKVGQKSINNIVDLTNFYMLMTGQPLHAYDYDKVKALSGGEAKLVVRNPKPGEKIKLLNGKEIEPRAEAIMIATDKVAIGLGGVMGGADTEVDADTKNIILEAANFDMYSVRRTSMAHGLFTDAVTRFNKGQSPLQNPAVLSQIVSEIVESGFGEKSGEVAGPLVDDNHLDPAVLERGSLHVPVKVTTDFINSRLGEKLSAAEMKKLLENVEFEVEVNGEELTVKAPFWRTDIELREDVVEEVGRLYGYDHLPLELPRRDLTPATKDPLLTAKARIRAQLRRHGANEVLTYSFVHGELMEKVGQDSAKAFQVANALSPDLQYYRLSLMPSLLDKVHPNIKAGYDEFALFEIGKTHDLDHVDEAGLPQEFEFTGLVVVAADKLKKSGAPYYQARAYLEALTGDAPLGFKPIGKEMKDYPVVQPYDLKRSALVSFQGGEFLGIIGELKPSVLRNLKLPKYTAGFEVDTTVLQKMLTEGPSYTPLSRFPSVKQDLTLKVNADLPYAEVAEFVGKQLTDNAPEDSDVHLEPLGAFQKEADHKQLSFRITVTGQNRTLTDQEINKVLDSIADASQAIGAERI